MEEKLNNENNSRFSNRVKEKLNEYSQLKFLYKLTGNLLFKRNLTLLLQEKINNSLKNSENSNSNGQNIYNTQYVINHIYGDYITRHKLNITEEMIKSAQLKEKENENKQNKVTNKKHNSIDAGRRRINYKIHTYRHIKDDEKKNETFSKEFLKTSNNDLKKINSYSKLKILTNLKNIEVNNEKENDSKLNNNKENEKCLNINNICKEIKSYNEKQDIKNKNGDLDDKKENLVQKKKKHHHRHHHYQHRKRERILAVTKSDSFCLFAINNSNK